MAKARGKKKKRVRGWLLRNHCHWCKRALTAPVVPMLSTSFTMDHIKPKSQGGRFKVPCCHACNQIKADMPVTDWLRFIALTPGWWSLWGDRVGTRKALLIFRMKQEEFKNE